MLFLVYNRPENFSVNMYFGVYILLIYIIWLVCVSVCHSVTARGSQFLIDCGDIRKGVQSGHWLGYIMACLGHRFQDVTVTRRPMLQFLQ